VKPPETIRGTGAYRGAEIRCAKGGHYAKDGHVCTLFMEGHPLHGHTFGVVGTITPLVDLWVEEGRLPGHTLTRSGRSGRSG
jgi:hypothetical protein